MTAGVVLVNFDKITREINFYVKYVLDNNLMNE